MGELIVLFALGALIVLGLITIAFIIGLLHLEVTKKAKAKHTNATGHTKFELRDFNNAIHHAVKPWTSSDGRVNAALPIWFCRECGLQIYPPLDEVKPQKPESKE